VGNDFETLLLRNLGTSDYPFEIVSGTTLPGLANGAEVKIRDYNGDGFMDVLLEGFVPDEFEVPVIQLFDNNGSTFIENTVIPIPANLLSVDMEFFDLENDGDLDLIISGRTRDTFGVLGELTRVLRNDGGDNTFGTNTTPTTPLNFIANVFDNEVTFSWDMASDGETAENALTYAVALGFNVVVGDPNQNILSSEADLTTGRRLNFVPGNAWSNLSKKVNLPDGNYYAAIQSIDELSKGSVFSEFIYFQVGLPSNQAEILSFEIASSQTEPATINYENKTVAIEVHPGTDVSTIIPTISISPGAIINPKSGTVTDFTNPVTYQVIAQDGSTVTNWVVTVSVGNDTTPPVLTNAVLPSVFLAGSDNLQTSVKATDNSGTTPSVFFKYKRLNEGDYTSIGLTGVEQVFSQNITQGMITDVGMEYSFEAKDNDGNTSTLSQIIVIQYDDTNSPEIPNLGIGGGPEDWRMFSIPFVLDDKTVAGIFESELGTYDNSKWRLIHYKNDSEGFVEFRNGLSVVERGKSYWFNSVKAVNIPMGRGAGSAANNSNLSQITLNQGWTQIGNPYTFDVLWSDVIDHNSATGVGGVENF
jgi:hypothetical protein